MQNVFKTLLEFLPLLSFFIAYGVYGLIKATAVLLAVSFLSMLCLYLLQGRVPKVMVISNIVLLILSSITVYSGDTIFIKLKPTIFYLLLSCILAYNIVVREYWIRHIFAHIVELTNQQYAVLSMQYLGFFLVCAVLNEVVWRNCSEQAWVAFKVFGIFGLALVFSLLQIFNMRKY